MASTVSFTLPNSEYQADGERLARQRRMAEALQQQALQPLQMPQQPGVRISPLAGLAKVLRAHTARKEMEDIEGEQKALAGQMQETRNADMSLLAQALRGRQATPGGLTEDASGNVTQADPLAAQSPVESLSAALPMLRSPEMQQAALTGLQGAQQREEQRTFQASQAEEARTARLHERLLQIDAAAATAGENRAFQERLAKERSDLMRELAQIKSQGGGNPYFTPVYTPQGVMSFNNRAGTIAPVNVNGQPVVRSSDDPNLQGALAGAKAGGRERGEAQAQAEINLPTTISKAEQSLQLIDQMVGSEDGKVKPHAGFEGVVGATWKPGMRLIEGTPEASFASLLDQVKGGAFLQAFESLKGGGQITQIEGEKATNAITRMGKAQSEAEFIKAAREFQQVIRAGVDRAKKKAGATTAASAPAGLDPKLWEVMTPEERALWAQ